MLEDLKPSVDRRKWCAIASIFEELDMDDRKRLEGYLRDEDTWSANGLSRALKSKGLSVGVHVILKHRRNECAC